MSLLACQVISSQIPGRPICHRRLPAIASQTQACASELPPVATLISHGEQDLLASLDQLHSCELSLGFGGQATAMLRETLQALPSPYPAWAYLGYYRIGTWLLGGAPPDSWRMAQWIEAVCTAVRRSPVKPVMVQVGAVELAPAAIWDDMISLFQEGGDFVDDLEPPEPDNLNHWRQIAAGATSWIAATDPELQSLMSQLQGLIIAARPGPLARQKGQSFGGATCFFLRGASILNVSQTISTAAMIERLVHEYAHAELFVLAQEQPLCLNRDGERHAILIRKDPRPMNGILHSLHVVSRVAELISKIPHTEQPSALMDSIDLEELLDILQKQLQFGDSSLGVITQHAQLTPLGEIIVASAQKRLQAAAAG